MRGVYVQGQCSSCRSAVGPRALVDRNSALATRAGVWLPKLKLVKSKVARKKAAVYKTKHWQVIRLERLALDSYICQSCGGVADQVHHLPSAVYGDERIEDLLSVCGPCNLEHRSASVTQAVLG
jgi:5-methylcytosine-specific restriction endonuclease McrA